MELVHLFPYVQLLQQLLPSRSGVPMLTRSGPFRSGSPCRHTAHRLGPLDSEHSQQARPELARWGGEGNRLPSGGSAAQRPLSRTPPRPPPLPQARHHPPSNPPQRSVLPPESRAQLQAPALCLVSPLSRLRAPTPNTRSGPCRPPARPDRPEGTHFYCSALRLIFSASAAASLPHRR